MSKTTITAIGPGNGLRFSNTRYPRLMGGSSMTDSHRVANVTTALLLAAGTGTRLQPLTLDAPKCLTEVGGVPLLERLVDNLRVQGFERLVVVIGYLGDRIQAFLQQHAADMRVDYVVNPDFRTTNNLYSLWLARRQIREPFLLVESDLIFETWMLDDMLQPDKMAVSRTLPWMKGTTVELRVERRVTALRMSGYPHENAPQYKTVNVYSFSLDSWNRIEQRLSRYVSQRRLGEYYEIVLAEMVADGTLHFEAVFFNSDQWYEIDTVKDLRNAEVMFPYSPQAGRLTTV